MLTQWLDFAVTTAGGACAFIFLFEGTRRMRAYGSHRTAIFMAAFGAVFVLANIGFSYWKHDVLKDMSQILQKRMVADELPVGWGKELAPEQRVASSLAMARVAFIESGTFRNYFDKSGERTRYSPTEEDIKRRDVTVVTQARLDDATWDNLSESFAWLIWGIVATAFGFWGARYNPPLPANPSADSQRIPGPIRSNSR